MAMSSLNCAPRLVAECVIRLERNLPDFLATKNLIRQKDAAEGSVSKTPSQVVLVVYNQPLKDFPELSVHASIMACPQQEGNKKSRPSRGGILQSSLHELEVLVMTAEDGLAVRAEPAVNQRGVDGAEVGIEF